MMAWSVSLKTCAQVRGPSLTGPWSACLARKVETSCTVQLVPLSWVAKRLAVALFFSRPCGWSVGVSVSIG